MSFVRCNTHRLMAFGAKPRPRTIRRLWGKDRGGRYRTHGHNSIR